MGERVRIVYRDSDGEETVRVIEPVRTFRGQNGHRYVRAYCHLRGEERTFRMDRVSSWTSLGVTQGARATPPPPKTVVRSIQVAEPPARRPIPLSQPQVPTPLMLPQTEFHRTWSPSWQAALEASPGRQAAPEASSPPRGRSGPSLSGFAYRAIGVVIVGAIWMAFEVPRENQRRAEHERIERSMASLPVIPRTVSTVATVPSPRPVPRPAPVPKPAPVVLSYRGVEILDRGEGVADRYLVPSLPLTSSTLQPVRLEINSRIFRRATGIHSPALEAMYGRADANGNGELSWREIETFQASLVARYRYQGNGLALRPDQFLEQGGGDCEDWALVSCGLMRFWGMTTYLGSFGSASSREAHAVCLVRAGAIPDRYGWIDIERAVTPDGSVVDPGRYVVVDYEHVGKTSNAVAPSWSLRTVETPEWAYGKAM